MLWGSKPKPEHLIRRQQLVLRRGIRELATTESESFTQQQDLLKRAQLYAKKGQTPAVRTTLKGYVRAQHFQARIIDVKLQLESIQQQLTMVKSIPQITGAIKSAVMVMDVIQSQFNIAGFGDVMKEFTDNARQLNVAMDDVGKAVDTAMASSEEEKEVDIEVDYIMETMNIEAFDKLRDIESNPLRVPVASKPINIVGRNAADDVDDLVARLDALKKS